jgi:shikimate kinase
VKAIALVGLMGAGKSTVGALVAARSGRTFVDVDDVIASRTGKTVRELWEEGGEGAYRDLESKVVLEALSARPDVVLAVPGGAVLDSAVRAALAGAFVVWLRADPVTLAVRVRHDDHRPLLGDRPREVLATMAQERRGLYAEVADLVVDTDGHDPVSVADVVLDALRDPQRGG